ncbi:synaptic vesicle glycoprotein 2C-like [Glossina fuscipes]|uniref:Synaptic vesicle glycoprotein 2C-like n=1 Tax=Glossina fuscipes TaxID=7396 RepID=A0A8U0WIU3_9MUSC|nr:synaptic vesicle glycoprotein 2C-like [Glossina fuscipes]XP_037884841.1 synaptic vesicle glycoprotein 2C-like [Glossina fuscipes]XP_037884843.1 synaptic vesicle glycoprotein 2C-like [Glossina fuscipes]
MSLDFLEDLSSNYENALLLSGFGKFHLMLLTICGLIYMNTAVGVTILSFVLPSATCDFQMTSEDKGWLSATPMLGMLIGSYFWGCLADTKGRRIVLVATLIADGVCGLLSSIAPYYLLFLLIRFFNGFNVAGTMGIVFPYLGEFQPTKYREKILCWMELFWTFGIIMLPGIAWGIIPRSINWKSGIFFYHSWNLFVAMCAVPSLVLGLWLLAFPESPKFLLEHGESDKALEILIHIFVKNTGQKPEEYACKSLRGPIRSGKSVRSLRLHNPNELKELLAEIWSQTKTLYKKPYLRNNSITCGIQFCLTTSYYTLMVWFPELFQRFDEFEKQYPDVSASVCGVSSIVVSNSTVIPCDQNIDEKVFFHTIIIGLACIPTSFWLPLCVHRLGIKFFLVFSLTAAGFVTIGLYFVRNSLENLILSCIFEALTSLSISTVYCVMVDLFPTNLRVMAAAMSMTFGRSGALLGNLIFGFLIDFNCIIPIIIFSAMLFVSGFLCWLLPNTGSEALE